MRLILSRTKSTVIIFITFVFCINYSSLFKRSIHKNDFRLRVVDHPPFIVRHGNFCVLPYAFDGQSSKRSKNRSSQRVTLVLHISADYVRNTTLLEQILNWAGPVSISVFVDQPEEQIPCIQEMLLQLSHDYPVEMQELAMHFYTTSDQCDSLLARPGMCMHKKRNKTAEDIAAYPANVGRNVAREFVSTEFILLADFDHLFSQGFERRMSELAIREKITKTRVVLVYRIFEIDEASESPKTKRDLANLLSSGEAVVFHDRYYKGGHSIPGLEDWLKKKEGEGNGISQRNLSMKSRHSWEPQFVSPSNIPQHDEAFPYMIRDNTCLRWELCRAGFSLHLVDDLFMYHRGIKTAQDSRGAKQLQSINRQRFSNALRAFKQRMDVEYPLTKDNCPNFRA